MCYYAEIGCFTSKGVSVLQGAPKLGRAEAPPLGKGEGVPDPDPRVLPCQI